MKKIIALMISLLLCFSMVFVSCGDEDESSSSESSNVEQPGNLPEENTEGDNIINFN